MSTFEIGVWFYVFLYKKIKEGLFSYYYKNELLMNFTAT